MNVALSVVKTEVEFGAVEAGERFYYNGFRCFKEELIGYPLKKVLYIGFCVNRQLTFFIEDGEDVYVERQIPLSCVEDGDIFSNWQDSKTLFRKVGSKYEKLISDDCEVEPNENVFVLEFEAIL